MSIPIFRNPAAISAFVPQTLAAAYAAAGIDRPAPPQEQIEKALRALPDAAAVARAIIAEAHGTTQDPAKFLAHARRRMADARTDDALREEWGRHGRTITAAGLPKVTDQAAQDLSPAFAATVHALRGAATELAPQGATEQSAPTPGPIPLDAEAAIARDAGAALTTARAELARLAVFSGISAAGPLPNTAAAGLARLVPVLAVEGAVVENCIRSIGQDLRTTNETRLGTTRAVRRLAKDARDNIDAAILGVAHGNYEGCSLQLNNTAQLTDTRKAISAAFERTWTDDAQSAPTGRPFAALL